MRKLSRKGLVKKLDKIVSQIVRQRDKKCVTCGTTRQLGAGHLFSRIAYSTRWDLRNVYAQCWPCNYRHEFDPYPLTTFVQKTLGRARTDALHRIYRTPKHFSDLELRNLFDILTRFLENIS